MTKISKTDPRYEILQTIPQKKAGTYTTIKDKNTRVEYIHKSLMGINYFSAEYCRHHDNRYCKPHDRPLTEYDGYYQYWFYNSENPKNKLSEYHLFLSGKCIEIIRRPHPPVKTDKKRKAEYDSEKERNVILKKKT